MTLNTAAQAARQHAQTQRAQNPADQGWRTLAEMDDDTVNYLTRRMTEAEATTWADNQRDWINDLARHES